jgi:hypothetical protein
VGEMPLRKRQMKSRYSDGRHLEEIGSLVNTCLPTITSKSTKCKVHRGFLL